MPRWLSSTTNATRVPRRGFPSGEKLPIADEAFAGRPLSLSSDPLKQAGSSNPNSDEGWPVDWHHQLSEASALDHAVLLR